MKARSFVLVLSIAGTLAQEAAAGPHSRGHRSGHGGLGHALGHVLSLGHHHAAPVYGYYDYAPYDRYGYAYDAYGYDYGYRYGSPYAGAGYSQRSPYYYAPLRRAAPSQYYSPYLSLGTRGSGHHHHRGR